MRVLLVDDHTLFRQGLMSLIDAQADFHVVGEAGSVQEAIRLARDLCPDVVLMDFTLPDGTGLDAALAVLRERPDVKIVFLTVHEDDPTLFAAIRSGAKGYMLKNVPVNTLLQKLRGLEGGEAAISPHMTSRILDEFSRLGEPHAPDTGGLADLTVREQDVLQEVATGATNREIASRLFISENTVKNHMSNILSKLNLPNRRQAARYAHRRGLGQTQSKNT